MARNEWLFSCQWEAGRAWCRKDSCSVWVSLPSHPHQDTFCVECWTHNSDHRNVSSVPVTIFILQTSKCQLCIALQFIPLGSQEPVINRDLSAHLNSVKLSKHQNKCFVIAIETFSLWVKQINIFKCLKRSPNANQNLQKAVWRNIPITAKYPNNQYYLCKRVPLITLSIVYSL